MLRGALLLGFLFPALLNGGPLKLCFWHDVDLLTEPFQSRLLGLGGRILFRPLTPLSHAVVEHLRPHRVQGLPLA